MQNVNKEIESFIQEKAKLRYPNEACGFVISKGNKTSIVEMPNESPSPKYEFLMNPTAWAEASEQGEILAVWHTHVDIPPIASGADLAGCEATDMPWLIVSVYKREQEFEVSEVNTYTPSGYEQPLEGRPYIYGTFDCWSLVVDYMKRNHGITLNNDYPRLPNFWREGMPLFSEHYADEDLVVVNGQEHQDGDILMFQTDASGEISHVGVYIGNGQFLHHVQGRLSRIDIYGGYWLKHTTLHLRHKSKC